MCLGKIHCWLLPPSTSSHKYALPHNFTLLTTYSPLLWFLGIYQVLLMLPVCDVCRFTLQGVPTCVGSHCRGCLIYNLNFITANGILGLPEPNSNK